MPKGWLPLFPALLFWLSASCHGGSGSSAKVLLAADDHPLEYPTTQGLVAMNRYLTEKSGGRLSLDIFADSVLGEEKVTIEQTQLGILDINRVNVSPVAQISPELGVLVLPYLFRDQAHMRRVLDGEIGEELLGSLGRYNLVGLCFYDSGARNFYNRVRPILKPADLVGLKIRVQESAIMVGMVKALGGSPTPMAFGEVYSSLATGVIDGAENNWPSYEYTGHYQVAGYYSLDEHSRVPEIVLMSRRTWARLSPEERALIKEAARASVPAQRKLWSALEEKARRDVEANGARVNAIPDRRPFEEAMRPLFDQVLTDPKLRALVERIRAVP